MFYGAKNVYALYAALGPRLDTVGVWGSNPHAPTNFLSKSSLLNIHCNLAHRLAHKSLCLPLGSDFAMKRKGGALQCDILLPSPEENVEAELSTLQFSI